MEDNLNNVRRDSRVSSVATVEFGNIDGSLSDLSKSGFALLIEGDSPYQGPKEGDFTISFPANDLYPLGVRLSFTGIVRHQRFISDSHQTLLGVEFKDLDETQEGALCDILALSWDNHLFWEEEF